MINREREADVVIVVFVVDLEVMVVIIMIVLLWWLPWYYGVSGASCVYRSEQFK